MKTKNRHTIHLVQGALIAAAYFAVTSLSSPISFGSVQFRISEALTILPVLTPAAIPGLTIGCIISNITSPLGPVDIICGSLATLLAAVCTRLTRKIRFKNLPILSMIFPVLFNGVIVGLEITLLAGGFNLLTFLATAGSVALGEAGVCYLLGLPLFAGLDKSGAFKKEVY